MKPVYFFVKNYITVRYRPFKLQAFNFPAAAQRHINLPVGERPPVYIEYDIIECLALAFMYCYCPGKLKRVLAETAHNLLLYPVLFFIISVHYFFPFFTRNIVNIFPYSDFNAV